MACLRAHHSFYCNLPLGSKDELTKEASTKGSNIHTSKPALSHTPTPAHSLASHSNNRLF